MLGPAGLGLAADIVQDDFLLPLLVGDGAVNPVPGQQDLLLRHAIGRSAVAICDRWRLSCCLFLGLVVSKAPDCTDGCCSN
jgi:hypothetical protein